MVVVVVVRVCWFFGFLVFWFCSRERGENGASKMGYNWGIGPMKGGHVSFKSGRLREKRLFVHAEHKKQQKHEKKIQKKFH